MPATWKNITTNITSHTHTIHDAASRGPGMRFIDSRDEAPEATV